MPSITHSGYVTVRVFSHATEDPEKVQTALRNTLPDGLAENAVFRKTTVTGHYKNPILLFEVHLMDRDAAFSVIQKLANGISSIDKMELLDEIDLHVEKNNLFLRLDKQSAYRGELHFSSNDPIHFKIHFKNQTSEGIIRLCREVGLLP